MADGKNYQRISLELSATWPGIVLLRFEPHGGGSVMVELASEDLRVLARLIGGYEGRMENLRDQVRALQALREVAPGELHDPKSGCKWTPESDPSHPQDSGPLA